jgi:hypothetical protein
MENPLSGRPELHFLNKPKKGYLLSVVDGFGRLFCHGFAAGRIEE